MSSPSVSRETNGKTIESRSGDNAVRYEQRPVKVISIPGETKCSRQPVKEGKHPIDHLMGFDEL